MRTVFVSHGKYRALPFSRICGITSWYEVEIKSLDTVDEDYGYFMLVLARQLVPQPYQSACVLSITIFLCVNAVTAMQAFTRGWID